MSFETLSVDVEVAVGEVGQADFTGHFIRTSAVEGHVIIEGEGLAGVTVTLSGGPAEEMYTMMTDADGMYRFEELRPGDYMVSISDFDTRDYEFAATSADVSVDLDETGTVDFTGVLLRTSGIAGRVAVVEGSESMALGDITVTLSGADDRTTMTDAGGQYSFAGLAAGDYTVSISVESDAYVFESMSSDVTLGDDESAIVNFEGAHARTASLTATMFIDELDKERHAGHGRAWLPVGRHAVGPAGGWGATDGAGASYLGGSGGQPGSTGRAERRDRPDLVPGAARGRLSPAGRNPCRVHGGLPPEVAMVLRDYERSDSAAAGYAINIGVGEAATQGIPVDITHTTINFLVRLHGAGMYGEPIPGATVTLYADADGGTAIGQDTTYAMGDYMGATSIRVARAAAMGHTVYAGISTDDYFVDPTADKQAVT